MSGAIVIDSREQAPYAFGDAKTVVKALPAGDYSIEGLEEALAVERKSVPDLLGSISRGRERFFREIKKLAGYAHACIVVEGRLDEVLEGRYRSEMAPSAVLGTVVAISLSFGVPVFFCGNRAAARAFTERFLLKGSRRLERGQDQEH